MYYYYFFIAGMMRYCPPGVVITDIWVNNGLSECLTDTVTSATLAVFLISCGIVQLWMYWKWGSRVNYPNLPR